MVVGINNIHDKLGDYMDTIRLSIGWFWETHIYWRSFSHPKALPGVSAR